MTNQIDFNQSVYDITEKHPELLDILVDLGFKPLANSAMRKSIGKAVSLKQGCNLINLPIEALANELTWNGYQIIGGEQNESN